MHLSDKCKLASEAVTHVARILHNTKTWKGTQPNSLQIWDAGVTWPKRATTLSNELGFLKRQLQNTEKEIKDLQQLLRERLELTYNRRDFLLTLVAAIYLPLSFATSFFGMNITTATPPTESGFSNYTSDWIANSPTDYQNTTKAIVSTIGTSGTLTYSWKVFGITAGALLLTLPLSLTLGTIVRSIYRGAILYARYWRMVTVPSFAAVFFFSAFGQDIFPFSEILYIICNCLFALYAYFSAYDAWRKPVIGDRGATAVYWTLMSMLITVCFLVAQSMEIAYYGLTFFPWVIVFGKWFVPWIRARRKRTGGWF